MFTTEHLPATFRPALDGTHTCGTPECGMVHSTSDQTPETGVGSRT